MIKFPRVQGISRSDCSRYEKTNNAAGSLHTDCKLCKAKFSSIDDSIYYRLLQQDNYNESYLPTTGTSISFSHTNDDLIIKKISFRMFLSAKIEK